MLELSKCDTSAGEIWRVFVFAMTTMLVFSGSGRIAQAADGDLDPTFGNGGTVVTDFNNGTDWLSRIAVQPDGKIVAIGDTHPSNKFALARYNPDGTLDATFGNGGKVITVIANVRESAAGLLILPNGKIMISGSIDLPSSSDSSFAILRYNSDGSLDTTFGNGGIVTTNVGPDDDQAYRLALQSDGKIVAAGRKGIFFYPTDQRKGNVALARYNPDGSLDPTFGNGGITTTDFGQGLESYALALIIQPDGRIIIAGESSYEFLVARYNPNGMLDTTFGNGGYRLANFSSNWDGATDAVLQPDGKIILVGWAEVNSPYDSFALARFNSDGSFDQSFGNGGKVLMVNRGDLNAAVLQSDGKLIALGISNSTNSGFQLLRFDVNGSLDTTFGNGGTVTTFFGGNPAVGTDLVFQPDGKLLAGGFSSDNPYYQNSDFALARYLSAFQLTAALSRKAHGSAGTFDINFPLSGEPGVECRDGGGNHTLVFTFSNNVVSGNASVTSGTGSVLGSPSFSGNTMTVNLTGVTDAQTITITLTNVTDSVGHVLPPTAVSMHVLLGDTNGNGLVNASDVSLTKAQVGQSVGSGNFREDVNFNGTINAGDVALVKSRVGFE